MTTVRYRKSSFKSARNATEPRLVVLDGCGAELLLGSVDSGVWRTRSRELDPAVFRLLSDRILPWHATLITSIDLPVDEFKEIVGGLSALRGIVSRIVIVGDPYEGRSGEYEITVGPVGATVYVLAADFFKAVAGDDRTPWEIAFAKYAAANTPKITPEDFDGYFSSVGLDGPFRELLLVRGVDPVVRRTLTQLFSVLAYDARRG